jgi:hypothetical protein
MDAKAKKPYLKESGNVFVEKSGDGEGSNASHNACMERGISESTEALHCCAYGECNVMSTVALKRLDPRRATCPGTATRPLATAGYTLFYQGGGECYFISRIEYIM